MSDQVLDPWCFASDFIPLGLSCTSEENGSPNPEVTISDPVGSANGDLIILHAHASGDAQVENGQFTVDAVWNEWIDGEDFPAGNDIRAAIWWRIKDPGDPATNDVSFSTGLADLYVCQYYFTGQHATKPLLAATTTSEASGDNEHYVGRMQLQAGMCQVVWWASLGTAVEDTGASNLPPFTLKDDGDNHGVIRYAKGEATTAITAYQRRTTAVTNWSSHSFIVCDTTVNVGGGSRPSTPTPDVDVKFDGTSWKDHAGTVAADFLYRGFDQRIDRIDDASGNANHLLSAVQNSGQSAVWHPPTNFWFGPNNGGAVNQGSLATRFDIPALHATSVTSLEIVLICELSDYDPSPEDAAILFRYNEEGFYCELQWNALSGTIDAVLFNNTTESGRVTMNSTDVSTLPYGRHVITASFFPSTTVGLRIDGATDSATPGVTGEASGRLLERTLGDSNWGSRRESSGLQIYECVIYANQTALTTGQKEAWETYAQLEYATEDES